MERDRDRAGTDHGFLHGGGEMGARIRAFPWRDSPLGDPSTWSPSWRTVVRILLSTHHPVFLFLGPDLVCLYNDAYARSLGPEKHPAILGTAGRESWAEIWDIIGPQIAQVMADAGSTWHENALVPITRNGRREDVYWTYSYSPIDDPAAPDGVSGVLVLCAETTAHVLAERRLRASELRWRQLFNQSPGFVCLLEGPEHRFRFANPGYQALIGAGEEILGRSVAEALPWAAEQGFVALLDQVLRSGEPHVALDTPVTMPPELGGRRHLDFVYQPIRGEDGAVYGVFVIGSDVTSRHVAQEALQRRTEQLRLACDAADLGIHVYEPGTGVLEWDARMRELWGLEPDAPVDYATFAAGLHPEDLPAMRTALERALDPAGDGLYRAEYRVRGRRDGRERWVQATGRVTFRDGVPERMVGTAQDVTERRLADVRRHEFLATLGHELRNPLAPIATSLYLIRHGQPGDDSVRQAHDVIDRQLRQMVRLLEDLLDVVRVTNGRIELRRERMRIDEIVQSALETAAPYVERGAHRLRISAPAGAVFVDADPVRLAQVFANLVINACKYSDRGSAIELVTDVDAGQVQVRVRDQGVGIAPELHARVFEMFSQAEPSLHRAQGGLGIGLALARGLVELHGGRIQVRSEGEGRGSEFVVTLPVAAAPAADPRGRPDDAVDGGRPFAGWRMLVVDDNVDAADSLADLLRVQGAEVDTAHDGEAALARAEALRPDALLLDIGLPGRNGYEVCSELRGRAWTAGLHVVALSGWGQESDRRRSRAAGFDAHLVKPVDYPELVRTLLDLKRGSGRATPFVADSAALPPDREAS